MTTTEAIVHSIETLPEEKRREVFDFVQFLKTKCEDESVSEDKEWTKGAILSALQGMEDEEFGYSLNDLKEVF